MVTGHRKLTPPGWTGNPYPNKNPMVEEWHAKIVDAMHTFVFNYAIHCLNPKDKTTVPNFITGMAIGADQLFAKAVLKLYQLSVPYNLHAACSFEGQDSKWPQYSKTEFTDILKQCTSVTNVSEPGYAPQKMQIRNQWMVDRCTNVLAIWDGIKKGGTYNCIRSAIKAKKTIIQLNSKTLEIKML